MIHAAFTSLAEAENEAESVMVSFQVGLRCLRRRLYRTCENTWNCRRWVARGKDLFYSSGSSVQRKVQTQNRTVIAQHVCKRRNDGPSREGVENVDSRRAGKTLLLMDTSSAAIFEAAPRRERGSNFWGRSRRGYLFEEKGIRGLVSSATVNTRTGKFSKWAALKTLSHTSVVEIGIHFRRVRLPWLFISSKVALNSKSLTMSSHRRWMDKMNNVSHLRHREIVFERHPLDSGYKNIVATGAKECCLSTRYNVCVG